MPATWPIAAEHPMPIVSITHSSADHSKYFSEIDLARLRDIAQLVVLGDLDPAERSKKLATTEYLVGSWGMPRMDRGFLDHAPKLKAVCYAAGSVKSFVTPDLFARGVVVTSAAAANAIPVAEVTLALIILANKHWFQAQSRLRQTCQWKTPVAPPGNFRRRVGLIGYGAVGRKVHAHLKHMDIEVQVHDPFLDDAELLACACQPQRDLIRMAAECEVISLHAPSLPGNRGMLGGSFFKAMQDGATFINTSRGALLDEGALVTELKRGRIYAHLDVTDPEPPRHDSALWNLPNCFMTPHISGSTGLEVTRLGAVAIDECLRMISGLAPQYAIDPASLERSA